MPATFPVSYTSVSRIHSAFPAINSVVAVTSAMIAQLWAGPVEAEINARLSKRYALPIVGECPLLTGIATREAIYRVTLERGLVQFPPPQQGRHPLQVNHAEDQKMLDRIMAGEVELFIVNSDGSYSGLLPASTEELEVWSTTKDYLPTMHEGRWEGMIQDPSKLDDIESDRENF